MGPVGFRGPSTGPIKMTLRNQYVEDCRPIFFSFFFFGDHIKFFFGYHIKIRTKLWHFTVCLGIHKTEDL